jgi:hypothetical protein
MDERTEYWKIATDRLLENNKEGDKDGKDKKQGKWQSLYAEERYAEPAFRMDLQRRKVVQWRLRERVRFNTVLVLLLPPLVFHQLLFNLLYWGKCAVDLRWY